MSHFEIVLKSVFRSGMITLWLLCLKSGSVFPDCAPQIFHPTILSAGNFTDVHTATVIADDGTYVQVQVTVTNIGPGGPNGTCRILAIFPDGTLWKASNFYGKEKWRTEDAPGPALIIGSCRFACTGDSTRVTIALKGGNADIAIGAAPVPVEVPSISHVISPPAPGDPAGRFYEYEILIPWGHALLALSVPDSASRLIQGRAMLEHSRSVGTAAEISRGFLIYRGVVNGKGVAAGFRWPSEKGTPAVGWIWKEGGIAPVPVIGLTTSSVTDTIDGKPVQLTCYTAPDHAWNICYNTHLFRYSFVDDLGPILGSIAKLLVGNPSTFFYKADFSWAEDTARAHGVAEYFKNK